jgi:integrase
MTVADVYTQERRLWVRLHEKGGKLLLMPCHHQLEAYLTNYMQAILMDADPTSPLFPSYDRSTGQISRRNLAHANAYQMVRRRARQAGIETHITNHSFRATGITTYLTNGGTLEMAAKLAGHSSTKTTQLYDRRGDKITLSEIERIRL